MNSIAAWLQDPKNVGRSVTLYMSSGQICWGKLDPAEDGDHVCVVRRESSGAEYKGHFLAEHVIGFAEGCWVPC